MISRKIHVISCSLLALIFCYACNNIPDCRNETEPNAAIVKFFNKTDSTELKVKFDSIKAFNTDSIFYLGDSISTFDLILDPSLSSTTYIFYEADRVETLSLDYSRNITIISENCGPAIVFSEIEIKGHSFDSAALINNFLDRSLSENIEIYY